VVDELFATILWSNSVSAQRFFFADNVSTRSHL